LDEARTLPGALGHVLLVGPLEQRVQIAARRLLHQRDQVLDPEELLEPDPDGHQAALVVSTVGADRLAARAESGDGNLERHPEVVVVARDARTEGAGVVEKAHRARHRGFLLDEVRKPDLHVRGVRVVVAAQLRAEAAKLADVDLAPVPVEQLDEAAHLPALALVRHRYAHVYLGDGVLDADAPGAPHLVALREHETPRQLRWLQQLDQRAELPGRAARHRILEDSVAREEAPHGGIDAGHGTQRIDDEARDPELFSEHLQSRGIGTAASERLPIP